MSIFSSPQGGNTDSAAPAVKYGLRDRGEKKVERPQQGVFKSVKNQVETVAKRSINLQKFKPDEGD